MAQKLLPQLPIDLKVVSTFVEQHIVPDFRKQLVVRLRSLTLKSILQSKNPYLIKVGGIISTNEFIERAIEESLRISEEELFAASVGKIAKFVCKKARGDKKSGAICVDLELNSRQRRREFLSGRNNIYNEMLANLGTLSQERGGELYALRAQKINMLTCEFLQRFSSDGVIERDKLIQHCFSLID